MSEKKLVEQIPTPNTVTSLKDDFTRLDIQSGTTLIVHSAMSKIGWTVGGAVAIVQALMDVLTLEGTLVMPTHTATNSDPEYWENPSVPEAWWPIIRAEMPAFQPDVSPPFLMGKIAETFWRWPGVRRSHHPQTSFAAWGKHAEQIVANHRLTSGMGEGSPLAHIYELDGQILLLGVGHGNNTSLHLAEDRADYPGKELADFGSAMLVDGERQWVTWQDVDYDEEDFDQIGNDYEASIDYTPGKVGLAEARLHSQRAVVDFAVQWLPQNRQYPES